MLCFQTVFAHNDAQRSVDGFEQIVGAYSEFAVDVSPASKQGILH